MSVVQGPSFKGSKPSERKGRHNPKFIGEIPGFPVGSRFANRADLSGTGVHAPLRAGIHGNKVDGAYSVVLSYGYEDDEDSGDTFIYTGQGGRDTDSSKLDKMQGKESWGGHQASDQEWKLGNKALQISQVTGKPVRVIRGAPRKNPELFKYAPSEGLRYDGLYRVIHAWKDEGVTGFKTCKFYFERLPNQPPLPGRYDCSSNAASSSEPSRESSHSMNSPIASFSKFVKPPREPHVLRPPYRPSAADIAKLKSHNKSVSKSHLFTPKHANATPHSQQSIPRSQEKWTHNSRPPCRLIEADVAKLKNQSISYSSPGYTSSARGITQPNETHTSVQARSVPPEVGPEASPSPSPSLEPEKINRKRPCDVSSNSWEYERWRRDRSYVESDEERPVDSGSDDDRPWATVRGKPTLPPSLGFKKRKI